MSDRTTKPTPRSKNAKANSRGGQTTAANGRSRMDPAAQLGELEFSDWYESPVFELSSEERMETRATAGRAPTRLLARAVIAAGARRERRRAGRQDRQPRQVEDLERAERALEPAPTPEPKTAEPAPPAATPEATTPAPPAPKPQVAAPTPEAKTAEPAPPAATPAAATPAPPAPKPTAAPPAPQPIPAEPLPIPELGDQVGWRKRAGALLDRWADKEVAIAARLDEALAPAMPWVNHDRKPADSRDDATV